MDVHSAISLRASRAFFFKGFDAIAHFQSLDAPLILLEIADGSLRFLLDGELYNYTNKDALVVKSRTAPVTIQGSVPVDVTMSAGVAARALVRGSGVEVTDRDTQDDEVILIIFQC